MQSLRVLASLIIAFLVQVLLTTHDTRSMSLAKGDLEGRWLFESGTLANRDQLNQVWSSVVSISSNSFSISNFLDPSKELKGKIRFGADAGNELDIELEELDLSSLGEPLKIEARTLKGVAQFEGNDAITLAVNIAANQERPTQFESTKSVLLIRLLRSPKEFKEYPQEIAIQVETADGKPVEGAIAARFQSKHTVGPRANPNREYFGEKKTDAEGMVSFPYAELPRVIVHEEGKQIAFPKLTPSQLATGKLKVTLAPWCEVRGSIVCEEFAKAEQPLGWTNVYLEAHGNSVADCGTADGTFDFLVPAGDYQLDAYGGQLGRRKVKLAVPPQQTEFTVDPIALNALGFALLKGKPAPELVNVSGWSDEPVKLADLKGKYVLLDFWGYWCGPCVEAMPILVALHEKFGDQGLAIVGIHVDDNGEVDSGKKFKEKTARLVTGLWQGKELPFPNALVSGEDVGDAEQRKLKGTPAVYGIQSFPTTILIDPAGNVVDKFSFRDFDHAAEQIEKLLKSRGK